MGRGTGSIREISCGLIPIRVHLGSGWLSSFAARPLAVGAVCMAVERAQQVAAEGMPEGVPEQNIK